MEKFHSAKHQKQISKPRKRKAMLKKIIFTVLGLSLVLFSGCVSQSKYRELETEVKSTQTQVEENERIFVNLQSQNEKLLNETKTLKKAIEDLKLGLKKEDLTVEKTESKNSKFDALTGQTSRPYSIMLSSCQQQESIQKVISKYSQIGIEPYVVKADLGENGIWWRIYAGHYETREEAIREKNKYGLTDKIVLKEPYENHADSYGNKNEAVNKKPITVQKGY
jgi:septal ring factor EnvC (AmiA/AmiB activator)